MWSWQVKCKATAGNVDLHYSQCFKKRLKCNSLQVNQIVLKCCKNAFSLYSEHSHAGVTVPERSPPENRCHSIINKHGLVQENCVTKLEISKLSIVLHWPCVNSLMSVL